MTKNDRSESEQGPERRGFLARASGVAMATGLLSGYGAFVHVAGRFLYPAKAPGKVWLYVAQVGRVSVGDSFVFRTPRGATVAIARRGEEPTANSFLALSSICPHLGCQVHWQAVKERFFCPCHNGSFDATGKAISGPPAAAGQSLDAYSLDVVDGLLYIEVPAPGDREVGEVEEPGGPPGPGHDPCLFDRPREV